MDVSAAHVRTLPPDALRKEMVRACAGLTKVLRGVQTVTLNGKTITFPTRLFINNEFVASVSGKTFPAIDPSTEQEICQLAEGIAAAPFHHSIDFRFSFSFSY
jgi:hypothetical protein